MSTSPPRPRLSGVTFCWNVTACSYAASKNNGPTACSVDSRKRLKLLALLSDKAVEPLKSGTVST